MKKYKFAIIYLTTATLLVAIAYVFVKSNLSIHSNPLKIEALSQPSPFKEAHFSIMKVDSFTQLINKAYQGLVTIEKKSNLLTIDLPNTNQLGGDFYNNNSSLLQLKAINHGFEIKHDKKTGSINSKFRITNNTVKVPNDILIKTIYKVLNK